MKKNVLDCFKLASSVALITHVNADADALASAVVFRNFLIKQFGIKMVDIFADGDSPSERLLPIVDGVKINKEIKKYHTAVIMDCPNLERVGKYAEIYLNAKQTVNIDHHATNKLSPNVKIVKIVSSTCEIVYQLLKMYGYKLTKEEKGKIYAGLITDTNNFQVGEFHKQTFLVASECCDAIDANAIYSYFFANNTMRNMQLMALATNNIVSFDHGKIIITHISIEEAKRFKASQVDFVGIANRLAAIAGCALISFMHPNGDGGYYVAMRAKKGFDVASIATKHGGGGHKGASAFVSNLPLSEIEKQVLKDFRQELKFHQSELKSFKF